MPPSGEKMWITNYMDSYNKVKKPPRKLSRTSRHSTPTKPKISERLEFLARPKTPSARPKTASTVQEKNDNNENTQPLMTFEEFNKQFCRMKFDSHGYVIREWNFPTESDLGVQGKHMSLSERDIKTNSQQSLLETNENTKQPQKEEKEEEESPQSEQEKNEEKTDEVPTVTTPVPDSTDYHWICWPEPKPQEEPPQRPHTSLGIHRAPTPYGGGQGDDIEDRPSSTIPGYGFGDNEDITRGPPMTYVPELKSWVNSSKDYDKDIAQSVMASMYPSLAPPLPPEALRPQRQMSFTYGGRRSNNGNYNSMSDPLIHYSQSWRPLYEDRRLASRQEMRHSVPQFPQIGGLERSKTDLRPMQRRIIRYPMTEDYIHERSMFMTTQPPCTGHFIIHPDWVSEKMGKRKVIGIRKNGGSRNGLRYGTLKEI